MQRSIVTFTDYGVAGPYTGQLHAVIAREAPGVPVISLMSDAPRCDPKASAYVLAALVSAFPPGSIFVAVVDPGVGSARAGLAMEVDGRWYVGPDNGLFELVARRAMTRPRWFRLTYRSQGMSATFHGRDLFAPVAAMLVRDEAIPGERMAEPLRFPQWPDDWPAIVYIDGFGNAWTGIRAASLPPAAAVVAGDRRLARARTFADVPPGEAFWYPNSAGLVEIAVNCGRADTALGLTQGEEIAITSV